MVKNVKNLSKEDVDELFYGKPHFCSLGCMFGEKIINSWKENVLKQEIGHYHNAPLIARIGMAYYESVGNAILKNEYYKNANKIIF
ncbi:hypothetical protein CCZ01_08495 [Helicobacter monodelphidis]|uniref:hypothetical protein n=1 Tax=Helicobacter sp. 15-1451 TaxID=2004995 RepID=UPI000DCE1075|nr:hypothetical protein [Helicobacter sp. 15-1451]RAX56809.1 hypothetical protein CCZ01_08495 [Helicobacter sp. 15-1451]